MTRLSKDQSQFPLEGHSGSLCSQEVFTEGHFQSWSFLIASLGRERATTTYGLGQLHNFISFNSSCYIELTLPSILEHHHLKAGTSQDGHLCLTPLKMRLQHHHHKNYSATLWSPKQSLQQLSQNFKTGLSLKCWLFNQSTIFNSYSGDFFTAFFAEITIPVSLGVFIALPFTLHDQHS